GELRVRALALAPHVEDVGVPVPVAAEHRDGAEVAADTADGRVPPGDPPQLRQVDPTDDLAVGPEDRHLATVDAAPAPPFGLEYPCAGVDGVVLELLEEGRQPLCPQHLVQWEEVVEAPE